MRTHPLPSTTERGAGRPTDEGARGRILVLGRDPADARLVRDLLHEAPGVRWEVRHRPPPGRIPDAGLADEADVVLLDLPDERGLERLSALREHAADLPVLVLVGPDGDDLARRALRAGARDHLPRPGLDREVLVRAIRYARESARLEGRLRASERRRRALVERLRHGIGDYRALARFGEEIETLHDIDRLIEHGLRRLMEQLQLDSAMFSEVEDGTVRISRFYGEFGPEAREVLARPIPIGRGINGNVAATGEVAVIEDLHESGRRLPGYAATGLTSIIVLPVRRDGRVRHTVGFASLDRIARIDDNAVRIARGFVRRLENALERVRHLEEIESTREATLRALGLALEYRDLETRGHTDRVVALAQEFGATLGLTPARLQALQWGAYLHDLGKIAVPDAILLKPARLDAEEFAVIRKHTVHGDELTRDIPFLPRETRAVVRHHHERWDGRGYPDGLEGEGIPLLARMFSLVDVYDALTHARPYKEAWSHEAAIREIADGAGTSFDPALVTPFLRALEAWRTARR